VATVSGTALTGYDIISNFELDGRQGGTNFNDKLMFDAPITKLAVGTYGNNDGFTDTLGGVTIGSHKVDANGMVTFFAADNATGSAIAMTTAQAVSTAIDYLTKVDIDGAGSGGVLAFASSGAAGTHTYVYSQTGSGSGTYSVVDLSGVSATGIETGTWTSGYVHIEHT
jgi:hypothetical protein